MFTKSGRFLLQGVVSSKETEIHSQQVIIGELKDSLVERKGDMGVVKERLEVLEGELSASLVALDKVHISHQISFMMY